MNTATFMAYAGGIIRITTSALGTWLAGKGLATEAETEGIAGAVILAATGLWSIWAKYKALQTTPANPATAKPLGSTQLLVIPLLLGLGLAGGCAFNFNSTPIMSESGGETVVANATNIKIGLGTKEATSIGAYKLSADGGLSIDNLDSKTDSTAVLLQAITLGTQLGAVALTRNPAALTTTVKTETVAEESSPESVTPETLPDEAVATAATQLSVKMTEAKATGKPLVVIAGSTTCSFCKTLDGLLDADKEFTDRSDIVLYRETAPWAYNQAGKWTGGGNFPVVRVTQWDSAGKIVCDKKLNRPKAVAEIEEVLGSCSAPK